MSKVDEALDIIREALGRVENPVIGFSGGKDSTVVMDLVRRVDDDVRGVFCDTGVEWPHTKDYVRSVDNITTIRNETEETFWSIVKKYGWPQIKGKGSIRVNRCCNILKDIPMKKHIKSNNMDLTFTGLTMDESRQRMMFLLSNGNKGRIKWVKSWNVNKAHPIWNWSEKEVWEYIKEHELEYNDIYKHPICARRCGCMPCTAYTPWKRTLAKENPKMLRIIMKMQGQSQMDDYECVGGA